MALLVPKFQKAVLIEDPGPGAKITIQHEAPVGRPGTHEVLVKLEVTGLCGSEVRALLGWGPYNPIVGHEGVGTVVEVGDSAPNELLNQRVGVKWLYSACGECFTCRKGSPNNCPKQINTGRGVPGTLQQYMVADARYLTPIPEELSSEVAAPLLCAGLTMAGAVAKVESRLVKNDWVVISGAGGGLGHLGVQIASRVKEFRVIAVDSGRSKRDLCLQSGAEHFIDFAEEEVEDRVKELTGEGADAVLVVSGSEEAFTLAPKLVRNMGIIVTIGLPRNDFNIPLSASLCSARALTITGVAVGTESQMQELLRMATNGKISPQVEIMDLEDLPSVFTRLRHGTVTGRIVVKLPQ